MLAGCPLRVVELHMNQSFRAITAALFGWAGFITAVGCLAAPEAAVITSSRANLRSAPSVNSDVVATLLKGQPVVVLTRIPVQNPQPEDPPSWARVRLPSSVKVWVYAAFVDAKSGAVTSKELKIRSGPGRNFPAVGELDQGELVSPVRTVEGWMQIDPPAEAVAYVAGNLLQFTEAVASAPAGRAPAGPLGVGASAAAPSSSHQVDRASQGPPVSGGATAPPAAVPAAADLSAPVTPGPSVVSVTSSAPPPPTVVAAPKDSAGAPAAAPTKSQAVAVTSASRSPAVRKEPLQIGGRVMYRQPELVYDDTRPRRVMREGVVKFSLSPDSPSSYELDSFRRGEDILNYLVEEDPKKSDMAKWSGKRVFVEGDEYRDRRWRTPVLKVISVQAVN